MAWWTRSATESGMTKKDTELTHAEMDENFVNAYREFKTLKSPTSIATYSAGTSYAVGAFVRYNDKLWIRIGTGTTTDVAPGSDAVKWREASIAELVNLPGEQTKLRVEGTESYVTAAQIKTVLDTGIKSVRVAIGKAALQSSHTTEVDLVAAPGDGKAIMPLQVYGKMNYSTAPYNAVNCGILLNGGNTYTHQSPALLESAVSRIVLFYDFPMPEGAESTLQLVSNAKLQFKCLDDPGTDGQGDIVLYITYREVTL